MYNNVNHLGFIFNIFEIKSKIYTNNCSDSGLRIFVQSTYCLTPVHKGFKFDSGRGGTGARMKAYLLPIGSQHAREYACIERPAQSCTSHSFVIVVKMREAAIHFALMVFSLLAFYAASIYAKGTEYVTCGSALKLVNVEHNVRLHSLDTVYNTGSRQQVVTGIYNTDNGNCYWFVKAETKKHCNRGEPIKCGDVIRLQHIVTKKNLHSHEVSSDVSGKQEVSCYGDSKGNGDTGDHWRVICHEDFWKRGQQIMLKHVDTGAYLGLTGRVYGSYTNFLFGQWEIIGEHSGGSHLEKWEAQDGVFVHPNDFKVHHDHTEL